MTFQITLLLAVVFFVVALLSPSRRLSGKDFFECLAYALVGATLLVRLL